jgi:hypothetical protein
VPGSIYRKHFGDLKESSKESLEKKKANQAQAHLSTLAIKTIQVKLMQHFLVRLTEFSSETDVEGQQD